MNKDLPPLFQKYHINVETMLHLDPGHKILWIMQAPNSEAIRDMIYESGLGQWNDSYDERLCVGMTKAYV